MYKVCGCRSNTSYCKDGRLPNFFSGVEMLFFQTLKSSYIRISSKVFYRQSWIRVVRISWEMPVKISQPIARDTSSMRPKNLHLENALGIFKPQRFENCHPEVL
jgi:hypothetical protein